MQVVSIRSDSVIPHCPVCGKASLSPKGKVIGCEHLMFVSATETSDEPWFVHESIQEAVREMLADEDIDSCMDAIGQTFPDPDFVLFAVADEMPIGLEVYVLYLTSLDE